MPSFALTLFHHMRSSGFYISSVSTLAFVFAAGIILFLAFIAPAPLLLIFVFHMSLSLISAILCAHSLCLCSLPLNTLL